MNKFIGIGNIVNDIELNAGKSGVPYLRNTVAINDKVRNSEGEVVQNTCFIDFTVFGRRAEVMKEYCKKGTKILIEGRLERNEYTDSNGVKRYSFNLISSNFEILTPKTVTGGENEAPAPQAPKKTTGYNKKY